QMVKAELTKTAYKGAYSTDWYMSDHTKVGTTSFLKDKGLIEIELPSGKNQETEKIKYVKIYPIKNDEESTLSKDEKVKSTGSGFIIAETGLLVTNWHVVNGNNSIEVYLPQIEKSYFAEIVLKDANNDVAILRLKDFEYSKIFEKSPPFTIIQSNQSKLGQDVFTLGFPLGDILGKSAKLSTGTLNSLYGLKDDPRLFQISTPIQPGNSGGALFNKNGEIVGIVVASLNAKYFYENADIIPQNVNFAVKSDYLLNLISMLPEEPSIKKRQNRLLGLKLEKQIEEISPFIVTIKVK
ncbi:MAG: trypsin-like peptidase domain-containing protein, partial [Bacteroidota bacterium]|nr:trypsin-like peptidase domain-containing protein [Bacteroidota bacterium]